MDPIQVFRDRSISSYPLFEKNAKLEGVFPLPLS